MSGLRIGIGYDIHRLAEGRPLVLGGKTIDFPKGLKGHSDGDVLVHALIDALLGAMGEKDIGQCFPDTDPAYKDIPSTELLVSVAARLTQRDWEVQNVDSIIIAEKPHLNTHIPAMKDMLCPILGVSPQAFGIKAKTQEGLGDVGAGRAMAAWAVVTLRAGS